MKFPPSPRVLALSAIAGLLVGILLTGTLLLLAWRYLDSPMQVHDRVEFEVPAGASIAGVSQRLAEQGFLEYPVLLAQWARLTREAARIKAGVYELEAAMTPRQLLAMLVAGDTKQYQVTLVEGWSLQQALEAIWGSPRTIRRLAGLSPAEIAVRLGLSTDNPEGLFFPDTYYYEAATEDITLLARASSRLEAVLAEEWSRRASGLPFESPYDALILASIVEKETAVAQERRQIAGVFVRRLQVGMRLQSDPTVIYGMGDRYEGNIDRAALEEVTLYNTYRVNGLPPTPIAMAGKDSIAAALDPLPGDALYFVSRGDGTHHFSSTLEEHNEAVRRYQLDNQPATSN